MKSTNSTLIGTILTLLGAALWGSCAVVSKYLIADQGLDTLWMTNFRMISSGIVLLIAAALFHPKSFLDIWKDKRSVIRLLAISALAFGVCQISYFLAIDYSNAGIASAIQQTAPIFVLIFVVIKEHRLPTLKELLVLALVIYGSFMIATDGDFGSLSIEALALVFGLTSAITAALYITLPAELIRRYGTLETVGWGLFIGGVLISPICQLWNFPPALSTGAILGLAYIILPGSIIAFAVFLYGTTLIDPVKAGVYNLFEPVVAALASYIFLSQEFSTGEIIGISAILIGIATLTISKGKA